MVPTTHFGRFAPILRDSGAAAVRRPDTLLASQPPYEIFYIPFEHVNPRARLVIVGITPGMNQLEMAYAEAQRLLRLGASEAAILKSVKSIAAFGGDAMRPNLLRMLRHFGFAAILGIDAEADLWGTAAGLLHSTSVVPNATFKGGKMFSGSFEEVLKVDALREQFEADFVGSLGSLGPEALYVALGKTPFDALLHCVELGAIGEHQLLGALAHPSRSGGSQVAVYLGEKSPDDLDPADPVRGRVAWLRDAYARMRSATDRLRGPGVAVALPPPRSAPSRPTTLVKAPRLEGATSAAPAAPAPSNTDLHYVVSRGKAAGTVLRPHVQDGHYIVSPTRFEADYVRVPIGEALEPYLRKGLSLRMSAPGVAPSLISPGSILRRDRSSH
ncbi:hypothetical protein M0638_23020 [Roseomonas sp. NAR14]|uniref:Uncharacterized protein n=1 Tax=Roseomonas acroporae TaxID=2937791 RepID=A0A9X1YDW6_9PROT|nr:hypothetical protein [Roseomonas acroporae]MCK8787250.1 hypothetical protein [Roseomonas acroporae]